MIPLSIANIANNMQNESEKFLSLLIETTT
jgi:hypothetical protein